MSDIVEKALSGEALDVGDVEELMKEDIWILGRAAARLTESIFKGRVTFVSNMILNYTNVCTVACRFCAFYRPPGHPEAYVRSPEEAARAAAEVHRIFEIRQILVQGGVNPELDVEYYEEMFRRLKERVPDAAIHGLSPIEVDYLAKRGRMSYREVLGRLRDAGMDTMAGGGGEILVDRVRRIIAPRKMSADSWLKVMEVAHGMGIMTNATMMYGHAETIRDRAEHLHRILELQRRTHGFLSFTAWNFEPGNSELTREFPYPMTAATLLRTVAVARLIFRDLLPNIQSSWLTNGLEAARMAMRFGANDFGGTLFDEMVMPATGLRAATVTRERIVDMIRSMGMRPAERDNWYRVIAEYRYRGRRQGKKIADPTRSVLEPSERAEIGIIGGSGLYSLEGIEDVREIKVHTPYGEPSDNLVLGSLGGRSIAFLPRHGRGHRIPPHRVNYRANVWALRSLGVSWVISVSAVGSLVEEYRPGDLVVPDQFIDMTKRREYTFFEGPRVAHVSMADPFCEHLRRELVGSAERLGYGAHGSGTYLCIEGPRFSTRAESRLWRSWGAHVIGMTLVPEVNLACEAQICYSVLALVTDYDVWSETPVTAEEVTTIMEKNTEKAKSVISDVARRLPRSPDASLCSCCNSLSTAVI